MYFDNFSAQNVPDCKSHVKYLRPNVVLERDILALSIILQITHHELYIELNSR